MLQAAAAHRAFQARHNGGGGGARMSHENFGFGLGFDPAAAGGAGGQDACGEGAESGPPPRPAATAPEFHTEYDRYNSVNPSDFYTSMDKKGKWSDPRWHVTHGLVLNLPRSVMPSNPCLWGDIEKMTPHANLLKTLSHIVSVSSAQDPVEFYHQRGVPRTVQHVEELVNDEDEWVGHRLWLFVLDPAFSIRGELAKMFKANRPSAHQRKVGATGVASEEAFATHVLAPYAGIRPGGKHESADADAMSERGGKTSYSNGLVGIMDALSVKNAMENNVEGVCAAQRNPANYGLQPGCDAIPRGYKPKYPDDVRYHRIQTHYFAPDVLPSIPLPNVMRLHCGEHVKRLRKAHDDLAEYTAKLSQQNVSARELAAAAKKAQTAEARIDHETSEIMFIYDTLQRTAPSSSAGAASISDLLSGGYVDKVIEMRNVFQQLKKKNERLYKIFEEDGAANAGDSGDSGDDDYDGPQGDDESPAAAGDKAEAEDTAPPSASPSRAEKIAAKMRDLRCGMLREFWQKFNRSDTVTAAVKSARDWYQSLPPESRWQEHLMLFEDVSPFANMVIRMMNDFSEALRVETNHELMFITLLVKLSAFRFAWTLKPNVLISGDAGTGKSYCAERAEDISMPGATLNCTHVTKQAFQGDQDMSDMCFIMHETPLSLFGVDEHGKEGAADPYFKNRLTSQKSITIAPDSSKDADGRKTTISVNRCMGTNVFITNDRMSRSTSAVMERFMPYVMRRKNHAAAGKGAKDSTLSLDVATPEMTQARAESIHGYKIHEFYFFLWEKAIEAGAMPDIDLTAARVVAGWIFGELRKEGVREPARRHVSMYLDLCRTLTMYFGVEMEFFSELAHEERSDPDNRDKQAPFHPDMLEGLVKWGVCTQEIAVFVMTLLEFLWVPKLHTEIPRVAAMRVAGGTADADGNWKPNESTTFRRIFGQGGAFELDPNYVEISDVSTQTISERIRDQMENRPSENDVYMALAAMRYEFIDAPEYEFYPPGQYTIRKKVNTATGEEVVKRRASVLLETFSEGSTRMKRFCIATHLINRDFSSAMRRAIPKALAHKFEPTTRRFITAFYVRTNERAQARARAAAEKLRAEIAEISARLERVPAGRRGAPHYKKQQGLMWKLKNQLETLNDTATDEEAFYNVLDVIDIEPSDEVKTVSNPYGTTAGALKALFNSPAAIAGADLEAARTASVPVFTVDQSIDALCSDIYWRRNRLDARLACKADPNVLGRLMWHLRNTSPRYTGINPECVKNYPSDWLEAIDASAAANADGAAASGGGHSIKTALLASLGSHDDGASEADGSNFSVFQKRSAASEVQDAAKKRALEKEADEELFEFFRKAKRHRSDDGT